MLALLFAAWCLYRVRINALTARLRNEATVRLAERERIARELHDTLLQATQGLIFTIQAATNRMPCENPARALLDRSLDRTNAVMVEGRDRIHELRAAGPSNHDLPEALTLFGEALAQARPTRFLLAIHGSRRDPKPAATEEVYRIGREALLDAFRHAEANRVEVHLTYEDDALRMQVSDDGRGSTMSRSAPARVRITGACPA